MKNKIQLSVRIDPTVKALVEKLAKKKKKTLSQLVQKMMFEALSKADQKRVIETNYQ